MTLERRTPLTRTAPLRATARLARSGALPRTGSPARAPRRAAGESPTLAPPDAPGVVRARCCGGYLPGDGPEHLTCTCGSDWAEPGARLGAAAWAAIEALLVTRSGARCEIGSGACLAGPRQTLEGLPRYAVSIHHRLPRGAGGTTDPSAHSLARLMLACGSGTTGCHGWAETNRAAAQQRGILIRHGATAAADPEQVALVLPGGMRVLLAPDAPAYLPAPGPVFDTAPWP